MEGFIIELRVRSLQKESRVNDKIYTIMQNMGQRADEGFYNYCFTIRKGEEELLGKIFTWVKLGFNVNVDTNDHEIFNVEIDWKFKSME